MRQPPEPVLGIIAPPPRPTFRCALWLASALSVPVFLVLGGLELLYRAVF